MENKINDIMNNVVNVVKEEFQLQSQSWNTYGQRVGEKVKGYREQKPDLNALQNDVKEEAEIFFGELRSNVTRSLDKLKSAIREEKAN